MCFCFCGFIVFCTSQRLLAEQVEVMNTSGTVEVLLEGADDYTAAEEGMTLEAGDKIKTGSGGSVELSFNEANSNFVRLNENTDAAVTLSQDEKMEVTEGEVFSSVSDLPSGSAFEIRTPTAVSGARGTDWVTKVGDDGTDVEAVDSVPYVRHFETSGAKSSQMTLIQPGQMTTVKRFQPPMQPRPMNPGRQQPWQAMKQQVRQRAGEAFVKRQQRPKFDRKDFIQQMKGRRGQGQGQQQGQWQQQDKGQDGYKVLRSDERSKGPFEHDRLDKPDKPFQQDRQDKPGRFDRQDKPGRFDGPNKPAKFDGPDKPGKFDGPDRPEKFHREDMPGNMTTGRQPGPDQNNRQANNPGNQPKPKIPVAPPRPRQGGGRR